MSDPLLLAVDTGSSSVRCSLWRRDGSPVDGLASHVEIDFDEDGSLPARRLIDAAEQAVDETLEAMREQSPGTIACVGWASFAMSWLGVDEQGAPVSPIYTYADQQSGSYAQQLRARLQKEELLEATHQRTGTPIHSAYAPSQMLRLRASEPDLLERVDQWQTGPAYIMANWMGWNAAPVSTCEAGWTGLLNRRERSWDQDLLKFVGVSPQSMPPVRDYTQSIRGLNESHAARWPELADVPFYLAVGDGAAANIGSGCIGPHRIALTIGTSCATRAVLTPPEDGEISVPAGLWSYPIDQRTELLGGALTDGGALLDWLWQFFGAGETAKTAERMAADLVAAAAQLPPDSHGLTLLPFLRGERSVGWSTDGSLIIRGISAKTTKAHLVLAAMEAIALRLREVLNRLIEQLEEPVEIYGSGAALRGVSEWQQILADVLQRPIHITREEEATSRGAARLAARAAGLAPSDAAAEPETLSVVQPRTELATLYEQAARRQQTLYVKLLADSAQFY